MARAKIGSENSKKKEMSDGNIEKISTPSDKKCPFKNYALNIYHPQNDCIFPWEFEKK